MGTTGKYKELLWGKAHVPSRPKLPVVLTSDDLCPLLRKNDLGLFDPYDWKIYVWAGQSRKELDVAWLHEMCHALVYCDGSEEKCNEAEEENVIKALQWSLTESLRKQGWSTPQLPVGSRSLAEHARCVRRSRINDQEAHRH